LSRKYSKPRLKALINDTEHFLVKVPSTESEPLRPHILRELTLAELLLSQINLPVSSMNNQYQREKQK